MKKKRFIVAIIITLVILLFPIRYNIKDGGSVMYKSLVYEVIKIHRMTIEADGEKPYIDGLEVKIFDMTIYMKTNE